MPKQLYEFLDFPFKLPWGQYPTGAETQQYIEDYAEHFKLKDSIETQTQVESVSPKGSGGSGWVFKTVKDGKSKEEAFDYCVIATGLYSKTKLFIPELPNREKFQGKVGLAVACECPVSKLKPATFTFLFVGPMFIPQVF